MIVNIETPVDSCRHALDYNEDKCSQNVAELIGYANMDSYGHDDIYETFAQYEKTQYYIRRLSFHASVNPSEDDRCSQEDVLNFVGEMMSHLGLGEQPFLVYRHFDIDRPHYHIVSIRADKNGRKIEEFKERQRLRNLMITVQEKYHFKVVEKQEWHSVKRDVYCRKFNPKKEVSPQLHRLASDAVRYSFKTDKEFFAILRSMGVKAEYSSGKDVRSMRFRGLDKKGKPVTHPMSEVSLGLHLYPDLRRKLYVGKHYPEAYLPSYADDIIRTAFKKSISENQFVYMLKKERISVHIHRNEDDGKVEDITFISHLGKYAVSVSNMGRSKFFQEMIPSINSGRWVKIANGKERLSMRELRQRHNGGHKERRIPLSAAINLLKPVSQPKGESGAGAVPPKTEKELYEEYLAGMTGSIHADFTDKSYVEKLM